MRNARCSILYPLICRSSGASTIADNLFHITMIPYSTDLHTAAVLFFCWPTITPAACVALWLYFLVLICHWIWLFTITNILRKEQGRTATSILLWATRGWQARVFISPDNSLVTKKYSFLTKCMFLWIYYVSQLIMCVWCTVQVCQIPARGYWQTVREAFQQMG